MIPLSSWLGPIRAPFLMLTPACMALGVAMARLGAPPQALASIGSHALLALLAALAAHVSVNALNEYVDFKTGLDLHTVRTPFSGGSGALPAHPMLAGVVLGTGLAALLLCCAIGLYFLTRWPGGALHLAPLGLVGVALVGGYTPWITRRAWLCLIAPGLGFGPLMVAGTQFALCGHYSTAGWLAAAVPFFLVNNLLLLNQFPDVEADRRVGRRTLPIVLGRPRCAVVLGAQWLLAYATLTLGTALGLLPLAALAGLLTAPLAVRVWRGVCRHADDVPQLLPHMGMNVAICLLTPLLMSAGIAWSAA